MKIKAAQIIIASFAAAIIVAFLPHRLALAASSLQLQPGSTSVANGATVSLSVTINTDGASVFGSDAIISYPTAALEFVSAANGNFFTDFNRSVDTNTGVIELHAYFATLFDSKSGSGTLATMTFRAKQGSGTAMVSFICNTSAQSSQIINSAGNNILSCGQVNQSTITLTSGVNPTPTPTSPPGPTATPTSAGGFVNVAPNCTSLSVSPSSGKSPLSVNLVCSGSDADNDITAAEFDFGDGQKRLIEKSVGQYGSISTTYTYPRVGSYTATCRVRDNNMKFSSTPESCQKVVDVKSGTTITTGRGTLTQGPIILSGQTVDLVPYQTPTPFLSPQPTPTEAVTPKEGPSLFEIGKIIIISLAVIGIGLFLRRLIAGSGEPPAPPPPLTPQL